MDIKKWGIWLIILCVIASNVTVFEKVQATTLVVEESTDDTTQTDDSTGESPFELNALNESSSEKATDSNATMTEPLLPNLPEVETAVAAEAPTKESITAEKKAVEETATAKATKPTVKATNAKIEANITNEFTNVDTTKAFGEAHTFYQKINIEQITPVNNATLVILVTPPYKGWFDVTKVSIGNVADASNSTFLELEDGTIEIKYHFTQLTESINFEVPIKVTSGTKVGANPENPAHVTSYFETSAGEKFGQNAQPIKLLGAIKSFTALRPSMVQDSEVGEFVKGTTITSWNYNIPEKELVDGLIDELLFYPTTIEKNSTTNPSIYLGQLELEYTLPQGIEPIILDEKLAKYDKASRVVTVYSNDNADFSVNTTVQLPKVVQFRMSGVTPSGSIYIPLTINSINHLDQGYKTRMQSMSLSITFKKLDSVEFEKAALSNYEMTDTTAYRESDTLAYVYPTVQYRNKTLNEFHWVMSIDGSKSELPAATKPTFFSRVSLRMGVAYEGTLSVYLSRDGIEKTKLVAENITAGSPSFTLEKTNYKYVIIEGDKDFKQEFDYTTKTNTAYGYYQLEDTSKVYSKDDADASFYTYASFNSGLETLARSTLISKARNLSKLSVNSNVTELTNNDEITDELTLDFSYMEYHEGAGTIVTLLPEGVNIKDINLNKAALGYQTVQNYKNSGKTALVIRLETVSALATTTSPSLKMTFKYTVTDGLEDGAFDINYMYIKPAAYQTEINNEYTPADIDTLDIDDNGDDSEALTGVKTNFNYHRTKQLITLLKASGTETTSFSDTNDTTLSYANEPEFDYQIELVNNFDNTDVKAVTVLTKIPKKDMKDFEGNDTINQLSFNLSAADTPEGFDVYYLTADASNLTSANEATYAWTTVRPTISRVTALKYVSNNQLLIKAGETKNIGYSVSAATQTSLADVGKKMDTTIIMSTAGDETISYLQSDIKKTELTSQKQTLRLKNQSINGEAIEGGVYRIYDAETNALLQEVDLANASSKDIPNIEANQLRVVFRNHPNENYTIKKATQEITMTSFEPAIHALVFEFIPDVESFAVNSSTLYLADIWQPADNIILTDKEGVQHRPDAASDFAKAYTVKGSVDTSKRGNYELEYTVNNETKKTTVKVISGIIVDATDETNELVEKEGEDNSNLNGGLIKLNYVSDFNFGEQLYDIKSTTDFSALVQKDTHWQDKERNPFINVENRQALTEDYTVSAAITKSFEMDNGGKPHELKGYQLNFSTGAANYKAAEVLEKKFTLDGDGVAVPIISSQQKGSKSLEFSEVELTTPAGHYQYNGEYSGEVTWSIATGP